MFVTMERNSKWWALMVRAKPLRNPIRSHPVDSVVLKITVGELTAVVRLSGKEVQRAGGGA